MMYNKIVRDCFFLPRHVGTLESDSSLLVHFRGTQGGRGAVIDLYMQGMTNKTIQKICFKTNGNPYIIASLEWLCREIEGRAIEHLPFLTYQTFIDVLEMPLSQSPVALYVDDVYKEALALLKKKFEE